VALVPLIEYRDASTEVRSVYDDIMKTRGVDWINNFWKALANDPQELARIWRNVKQVMAPGALDPLAVVGLANETNRLANGLRIDVDRQFKP
jgi:hypothetical protein